MSSEVKIAEKVGQNLGKLLSASTIRRTLDNNVYYGRQPRKKPFISKNNQTKRLNFAKKYCSKAQKFWENILFSEKSKFELFGAKNRSKIWRRKCEPFKDQNLIKTVKHGGGSVMVWGCMASSGVAKLVYIESTMRKEDFP